MTWKRSVLLPCHRCKRLFAKPIGEYSRRVRLGKTEFYCDRSCARKPSGQPRTPPSAAGRRDELTPFRWFMARIRYRKDKGEYDISAMSLLNLWTSQGGICPFTGWKMILPVSTNGWDSSNPANASLDRIDCSLGYMFNNIRFVSLMANICRQSFSDDDVRRFCTDVHTHQTTR